MALIIRTYMCTYVFAFFSWDFLVMFSIFFAYMCLVKCQTFSKPITYSAWTWLSFFCRRFHGFSLQSLGSTFACPPREPSKLPCTSTLSIIHKNLYPELYQTFDGSSKQLTSLVHDTRHIVWITFGIWYILFTWCHPIMLYLTWS